MMVESESKGLIGRVRSVCPHWYVKEDWPSGGVAFKVENAQRCQICGHRKIDVTVTGFEVEG